MLLKRSHCLAVLACVVVGCSDNTDAVAPDPGLFDITLTADPSGGVSADGESQVRLIATIQADAPTHRRNVTFTTTGGTFSQGTASGVVTITADESGSAIALLKAPRDPGIIVVHASNGGPVSEETLTFVRALPERVDVDIDRFALKAGPTETLSVTIVLRRNSGKVTAGTPAQLRANTPDGTPIGLFGNVGVSDSEGAIVAKYTAGTTTYRGPVIITATATGSGGSVLTDQVTAEVVNP